MDDPDVKLLIAIVVIAGLAIGAWYFRDTLLPAEPEPIVEQPEAAEPPPAAAGPPRRPI